MEKRNIRRFIKRCCWRIPRTNRTKPDRFIKNILTILSYVFLCTVFAKATPTDVPSPSSCQPLHLCFAFNARTSIPLTEFASVQTFGATLIRGLGLRPPKTPSTSSPSTYLPVSIFSAVSFASTARVLHTPTVDFEDVSESIIFTGRQTDEDTSNVAAGVDACRAQFHASGSDLFRVIVVITDAVDIQPVQDVVGDDDVFIYCLLYTSPSPRDQRGSRMPSSA